MLLSYVILLFLFLVLLTWRVTQRNWKMTANGWQYKVTHSSGIQIRSHCMGFPFTVGSFLSQIDRWVTRGDCYLCTTRSGLIKREFKQIKVNYFPASLLGYLAEFSRLMKRRHREHWIQSERKSIFHSQRYPLSYRAHRPPFAESLPSIGSTKRNKFSKGNKGTLCQVQIQIHFVNKRHWLRIPETSSEMDERRKMRNWKNIFTVTIEIAK